MCLKPAFPQSPGGLFIGMALKLFGAYTEYTNSFYMVATLTTLAKKYIPYPSVRF